MRCYFYPRSPCGERHISCARSASKLADFYPRSPCGERPRRTYQQGEERAFLSTLSLRRATNGISLIVHISGFLSTLSLRRATRQRETSVIFAFNFYPRSPCGERLAFSFAFLYSTTISIHALLAESDGLSYFYIIKITNFYPRSPCGERQKRNPANHTNMPFLSTLSLRRATILPPVDTSSVSISIHALLAESDFCFSVFDFLDLSFLSTLSLRRATNTHTYRVYCPAFLSTLSLRRAT